MPIFSESDRHWSYQDKYAQQLRRVRRRWILAPVITLLTASELAYSAEHHFLQPHALIFIALSCLFGYWMYVLSVFTSWWLFLKLHVHPPSPHAFKVYRVGNARRKAHRALLHLTWTSGAMAFSLTLWTSQQIGNSFHTHSWAWVFCLGFIELSNILVFVLFLFGDMGVEAFITSKSIRQVHR